MIEVINEMDHRIRQGDIYKDIRYIKSVSIESGIVKIKQIVFPLVIVLTQDCDLEQDYLFRNADPPKNTQDKWLISVLVAPLYNAEHVYTGQHLSDLGITMELIPNRTPRDYLLKNERPRYYYLEFDERTPIVPSIIDFKHYFSVDIEFLQKEKNAKFVCSVSDIYRVSISDRFAHYLARIGLPNNNP